MVVVVVVVVVGPSCGISPAAFVQPQTSEPCHLLQ